MRAGALRVRLRLGCRCVGRTRRLGGNASRALHAMVRGLPRHAAGCQDAACGRHSAHEPGAHPPCAHPRADGAVHRRHDAARGGGAGRPSGRGPRSADAAERVLREFRRHRASRGPLGLRFRQQPLAAEHVHQRRQRRRADAAMGVRGAQRGVHAFAAGGERRHDLPADPCRAAVRPRPRQRLHPLDLPHRSPAAYRRDPRQHRRARSAVRRRSGFRHPRD